MKNARELHQRLQETDNEADLVWAHCFLTTILKDLEARSPLLRVGLQGLRDAAKFERGSDDR